MKASKSQLREEIRALRSVGSRMSNVCFNLGQDGSTITNRRILSVLVRNWDKIKRAESRQINA